ncbi:hypothetical protein AB0J80_04530 [Actinoplanes sp. NPDC049548]|uniref:protein kinase domain-containing protein n=1 Tax=Actinoplanes sp. NPDC049548 TaxID=3155152 RepID=UPI003412BE59
MSAAHCADDRLTVADAVRRHGPLTGAHLRHFAEQLGHTLADLHREGRSHGALTPDAVVVDGNRLRLTDPGSGAGLPAFTAPEALSREPGRSATPAQDVYAWGCLVAYAATGRSPFAGDSAPAVLSAVIAGRPRLDELPEPLRHVAGLALAKDPMARPFAANLVALLAGTATPGKAAGRDDSERFRRFFTDELEAVGPDKPYRGAHARRGRGRWPVAVAVVAALGGGAAVAVTQADVNTGPRQVAGRPIAGGRAAGAPDDEPAASPPGAEADEPAVSPLRGDPVEPTVSPLRAEPVEPAGGEPIVRDRLARPGAWTDLRLVAGFGGCVVDDGLRATLGQPGVLPCRGPQEEMTDDIGVQVTARLESPGACATIWFHWRPDGRGSALRLCERRIEIAADPAVGSTVHGRLALDPPVARAAPTRLHLVLRDRRAEVWRNHRYVGAVELPATERDHGQVRLGLTGVPAEGRAPYRATFTDVDIRSL